MRDCGTCSACCRWPEIPELRKPRGAVCDHLKQCGHGCVIYPRRPRACVNYRCAWIDGAGRSSDRPDDCGVLIDQRETEYGDVLVARDLGGPTAPKRKAIKNVSRDMGLACLMIDNDNPEKVLFVRGPRDAVAALVAKRPEMGALV